MLSSFRDRESTDAATDRQHLWSATSSGSGSAAGHHTGHHVPAHHGASGGEAADEHAKAAAEGNNPDNAVPGGYRWETSPSHMTRAASEARSQTASGLRTAQETPDESTSLLLERSSDASSSGERQSQWQDGTTSCCQNMPPLAYF